MTLSTRANARKPTRSLLSAAAVVAFASPALAANCTGILDGSFCLSNCQSGYGIYISSPDLISGISVGPLQVIFDSSDPWNPKVNSSTTVKLSIPEAFAGLDLNFFGAGTNLVIYTPDGTPSAALTVSDYSTAASGSSSTSQVVLPLTTAHDDHLSVTGGDQTAFGNFFAAATLASGDITLTMKGYADTEATATETGVAGSIDVCLKYVPMSVTTTLTGLGGLTNSTIEKPVVLGGNNETGIALSIPLTITSPSDNVLLVANTDAIFDMVYEDGTVGTITVPDLVINPGANTFTAKGFIHPDTSNSAAVAGTRALLSAFTGGDTVQVTVKNGRASNMPSLNTAFGSVVLSQDLPPNKESLIISTNFTVPSLVTLESKAGILAYNPFEASVDIVHIKSSLIYNNQVVGTIDQDVSGFTLPAGSQAYSPWLDLVIDLDLAAVELMLDALAGKTIIVDTSSALTIDFGGYSTPIDYVQNNVTSALVL